MSEPLDLDGMLVYWRGRPSLDGDERAALEKLIAELRACRTERDQMDAGWNGQREQHFEQRARAERAEAERDHADERCDMHARDASAAEDRIANALELHVPSKHLPTVCNECRGGALLPCPTLRALTDNYT